MWGGKNEPPTYCFEYNCISLDKQNLKKKKKGVSLYAWQRGFRIIVLVSILIILVRTFCKTHKKNYKLNKNQRQARILEAPLSNQQTQPVSMMCTLHRPFMPYSLWKKNEGIWFLWNLLWIWWVWRLVGIYLRKSNKAGELCISRLEESLQTELDGYVFMPVYFHGLNWKAVYLLLLVL